MIEVDWCDQQENAADYEAEIRIIAYNKTGLLAEISVLLAAQEIPVSAISAHKQKDGTYVFNLSIVIKNTQQLNKVIRDLNNNREIIDVTRVSS